MPKTDEQIITRLISSSSSVKSESVSNNSVAPLTSDEFCKIIARFQNT